MTQYGNLNVKLFYSQLNKLKSIIKSDNEETLNLSSNVVGESNNETNFPHKLLSTNTQVLRLYKAFANGLSANIKLSKTKLSRMVQSGGSFLGSIENLPHKLIMAGIKKKKKERKCSKKCAPILAKNIIQNFVNKKIE